ncbi:MAG: flagellar filament capping protein FliD [Gammaproteobacteria bacterium]|nr:flagellar filament capping protein FliD [Gammaproteobacteria bacterium]
MGSITSAGVGSGLPLDSIIQSLVNAEAQPKLLALNRKEANLQTTLSAVGALKSAVSKFNDAVKKLSVLSDFQKVKATSSDTASATASATTSALAGTYNIVVNTLAKGSRAESAATFSNSSSIVAAGLAGTGTLTFTVGASNFTVDVTNTTTFAELRTAINDKGTTLGVTASIVNTGNGSTLVLNSSTTGVGNSLAVTNNDANLDIVSTVPTGATAGLNVTQSSQNAQVTFDGIPIISTTNTFTDIVDGVTLTTTKESAAGTSLTLTVANDTGAISTNVKGLVDSFNEMLKLFKQLGSASGGAAGPLVGDALLRQIESRARAELGKTFSTGGDFDTLAELGVATNRDGTLSLDSSKLSTALDKEFLKIGEFFAGATGLAASLSTTLNGYISSTGSIAGRETSLQTQLRGVAKDRENLDFRIQQLEARLRKQYAALDSLVARLNSTGSFLTQNLTKSQSSKS